MNEHGQHSTGRRAASVASVSTLPKCWTDLLDWRESPFLSTVQPDYTVQVHWTAIHVDTEVFAEIGRVASLGITGQE